MKILFRLIFLVNCKMAFGQELDTIKIVKLRDDIFEYCVKGDSLEGIKLANEYLKYDSSYAGVYFSMGYANSRLKKATEAFKHYKKARSLNKNHFFTVLNMAVILVEKDDFALGSLYSDTAIALNKNNSKAHYYKGRSLAGLGELEKGIQSFSHAIEIDSTDPAIYCDRGNLFSRIGDFELALKEYDKSLLLNNKHYETFLSKSLVLLRMNEFDSALKALNEAKKLKSNGLVDIHFAMYYSLKKDNSNMCKCMDSAKLRKGDIPKDFLKDFEKIYRENCTKLKK